MNVMAIRKRNMDLDILPKDWAECLGITLQHAYKKLNGQSVLTLGQAIKIQELLKIDDEEFGFYFLSERSRIS